MTEPIVRPGKLSEFRPQRANANRHTERGLGLLEKEMGQVGYVAPMTAAADGEIIDGSARLEESAVVFDEDVLVVEHDGQVPIVMVRRDVPDAESPLAKRIAYGANRVFEVDLSFSPEQIAADLAAGMDLSGLWYDWELDNLKAAGDGAIDPNAEWQGMPEFGNTPRAVRSLYIHFPTHEDVQEFIEKLGISITDDTKSVWYPERPENLKGQFAEDEA